MPHAGPLLRSLQESSNSIYVYNQSFTNFSRVFLNFFPPVRNSATGQDFLSAAVAYIDVRLKLTQTSTQANRNLFNNLFFFPFAIFDMSKPKKIPGSYVPAVELVLRSMKK